MSQPRSKSQSGDIKYAAWAGIVQLPAGFIVLIIAGSFPHVFPVWDEPPSEIVSFMVNNAPRVVIGCFGNALAFLLMIWFVVGLTEMIRSRTTSPRPVFTQLITPCAVATVSTFTASTVLWLATLLGALGHPVAMSTSMVHYTFITSILFWPFAELPAALMMIAAGVATLQVPDFPTWLAKSAFPVAALNFAISFAVIAKNGWLAPLNLTMIVPMGLIFGWMTAAGVVMLRAER
ncbi:hypothetical protein AB0K51_21370 [Kitasatospora sp. NPDC049285]|uniref:hypothetical protein n=1 Tax=Kitasatospora sp. NPDC049285 TaxID=3157096 RepID=UPI0034234DD3